MYKKKNSKGDYAEVTCYPRVNDPSTHHGLQIPGDSRVKRKETEKILKYQSLRDETKKLWVMKKVMVTPVVNGPLRAVFKAYEKYITNIGAAKWSEVIQKTALLGTARILRRALSL
uniref:Uncharacterized protein n=1 Tax=Octopus bimaculoides TaxID=37653 RepID=A0A0L8HR11_OCTBM